MKTGALKVWHSSVICWSICVLFGVLSILWQVVTVKPYPDMERDYFIGTIAFGIGTLLFFGLALRARRRNRL
jgi:hypothetical protein